MKIAIQVPIKTTPSERLPGKNFMALGGKPLAAWLLDELSRLSTPADIWIDSEDPALFQRPEFALRAIRHHLRPAWFAGPRANGNHLLSQFAHVHPDYDLYAQAFITAPGLTAEVVDKAFAAMVGLPESFDSLFLAREESGLIWFRDQPVNQQLGRPDGLPRTQDAKYLKETTGLYIITRAALFETGCRIGRKPWPFLVDARAALDIDTLADVKAAEEVLTR